MGKVVASGDPEFEKDDLVGDYLLGESTVYLLG